MACPNPSYEDVPITVWVVCRREDGPLGWAKFFAGGVDGWVDELADATTWPTFAWAKMIARNFPGAFPVRVYLWEPLDPAVNADDLGDARVMLTDHDDV